MASPPYGANSPSAASPLALPRQRPSLALPNNIKSCKPSINSAASSAHPLRQTSFPPADSLEAQHALAEDKLLRQYSPSADGSLDEFSDDNDIRSAISGPAAAEDAGARKRKRPGEKRPRGRPGKQAAARGGSSLVNGDDGRSQTANNRRGGTAGAPSVLTADDADAEAEDDDADDDAEEAAAGPGGGRVPLYEGGQMTKAEQDEEHARRHAFYETASHEQNGRYESFQRAKIRVADLRKLVNQTLSQSVPQNVVMAVSSYAKMFAGMLIEEAREVQAEWEAVEEERADGGENRALKRLKRSAVKAEGDTEEQHDVEMKMDGEANGMDGIVKREPTSPNAHVTVNGTNGESKAHNGDDDDVPPVAPGGAGGLSKDVKECDRGPLLPDHLREALRRYKKRRAGGPVGFTGLSLEGRENTAARMGGRRLFR